MAACHSSGSASEISWRFISPQSARRLFVTRDLLAKKLWEKVLSRSARSEQHVAARLPTKILAKLRDLHARGLPINSDPAFFHFGGGMSVRNLCRQRLGDNELAACGGLGADRDSCYIGVLAGIAAVPM
jgi:hypothetical protein